jgi:hypothetical protein
MRTAVGMSSGLTDATSTDGAGGGGGATSLAAPADPLGDPVEAGVAPGLAVVLVVAAGFLGAALSFGPAAALAVTSNEDRTTTVDIARMRNLQPARAGDHRPR